MIHALFQHKDTLSEETKKQMVRELFYGTKMIPNKALLKTIIEKLIDPFSKEGLNHHVNKYYQDENYAL